MPKTILLVDYENIQPDFRTLNLGPNVEVKVFLSKTTCKLKHREISQKLNLEVLNTGVNGKNALDFHIVFYIGVAAAKNPDNKYIILSKDKGFDALAGAPKKAGIKLRRITDITQVPGYVQLPGEVKATPTAKPKATPLKAAPRVDDASLLEQWLTWLKKLWTAMPNKPTSLEAFKKHIFTQLESAVKKNKLTGHQNLKQKFDHFISTLQMRSVIKAAPGAKLMVCF